MNGKPAIANSQYLNIEYNKAMASNSPDVAYAEKRKMIAASRVPIPPRVTGIIPINIAIGSVPIKKNGGTVSDSAEKSNIVCKIARIHMKNENNITEKSILLFSMRFFMEMKKLSIFRLHV